MSADGPGCQFDSGSCLPDSFQGQGCSGSQTSDRRILPGLRAQLECASRRHINWMAYLMKISFNMQVSMKTCNSNSKFGGACRPTEAGGGGGRYDHSKAVSKRRRT
jgi:hypothetical protein